MKARLFAAENRKWWTLVAVSFGLFMIMLDNTVVNVALPSIHKDLGISTSELEWVVNAYPKRPVSGPFEMELAGLEPATSWVRFRRSSRVNSAWLSAF